MLRMLQYGLTDALASRWLFLYALILAAVSAGLFYISGSAAKSMVSLLNIVLVVVPLMGTVFGSVYFYSRRPFIDLLLAQPVSRSSVFISTYLGLSVPLCLAFTVGLLVSFLAYGSCLYAEIGNALLLLGAGIMLTFSFVAIAFLIAVAIEDRMKGTAAALLLWLTASLVYDGVILAAAIWLADYPVENLILGLCALNPVSLARVMILLNLDISALMGYTGTVFRSLLGVPAGESLAALLLLTWVAVPLGLGLHCFRRKDL